MLDLGLLPVLSSIDTATKSAPAVIARLLEYRTKSNSRGDRVRIMAWMSKDRSGFSEVDFVPPSMVQKSKG